MPLDPSPPTRKIRIIRRQSQESVQVVRENHDRIDNERPLTPSHTKRGAQGFDTLDKNLRAAVGDGYGEEVCTPGNEISSKTDHAIAPPG